MEWNFKILMVGDWNGFGKSLKVLLQSKGFQLYTVEIDLSEMLQQIVDIQPDMILLYTSQSDCFPSSLLRIQTKPPIFVVFSSNHSILQQAPMYQNEASARIEMPCDEPKVTEDLSALLQNRLTQAACPKDLLPLIFQQSSNPAILAGECVRIARIPAHLRGCRYIQVSITIAVQKSDALCSISKEIYPKIADDFQTTPVCVERAIHNALVSSWQRGGIQCLYDYLKLSDLQNNIKPPSNAEFIATISDRIQLFIRHKESLEYSPSHLQQ